MTSLSIELFSQVNYWAVITSGLVAFTLGGIWYSPALFEGAWMSTNGYSSEQVQAMMSGLIPFGFIGALVTYFAIALVFALFTLGLGIEGAWNGALLAVLIWFGFVASSGLTITLFSPRALSGWLIDAGFQFTFLVAAGAIIGAWR